MYHLYFCSTSLIFLVARLNLKSLVFKRLKSVQGCKDIVKEVEFIPIIDKVT